MTSPTSSLAFDPICGMWLEADQTAATYTYLGQTYAFCCAECRDLFVRPPESHVVRLAHGPEQSMGHRCPVQRGDVVESARKPGF